MTRLPAKAHAWDLVSGSYWNSGYYGGPAPEHDVVFARLMRAGAPTAVVGASTVSLSRAAQDAGAELHVLDFAPGILREAGEWLRLPEDRRHLVDVTGELPERLRGRYHLVVADRLVNRFSAADLPGGLRGLRDLVAEGGTLALTVRFGWYDRDRQIHDALTPAEQRLFWRPDVGEIDYAALPDRDIPCPPGVASPARSCATTSAAGGARHASTRTNCSPRSPRWAASTVRTSSRPPTAPRSSYSGKPPSGKGAP